MYAGLTNIVKGPAASDDNDEMLQTEQDAFASGQAIAIAPVQASQTQEEENTLALAVERAILGEGKEAQVPDERRDAGQLERLAGWQVLPDWPAEPPRHNFRDSASEATPTSAKAYRGFGNSSPTAIAGSRKGSNSSKSQHQTQSKRRSEKVVLVPTESHTPPVEKARPVGLQAFLESSEEDETESESETETESEDEEGTSGIADAQQEIDGESEEETSSEGEESDDEEDAAAPLVQIDQR